jgi:hypothetical protein
MKLYARHSENCALVSGDPEKGEMCDCELGDLWDVVDASSNLMDQHGRLNGHWARLDDALKKLVAPK